MSKATQELLDELANPSIIGLYEARSGLIDSLEIPEKIDAQAAVFERLIRRALLDEEDAAVRGKLAELRQRFAGERRQIVEWKRCVDGLVNGLEGTPPELNGVLEEREVPDPEAHEEMRTAANVAREKVAAIEDDDARAEATAALDRLMEFVEPVARHVAIAGGKTEKVRTDGFRAVAERAGYTTRSPE